MGVTRLAAWLIALNLGAAAAAEGAGAGVTLAKGGTTRCVVTLAPDAPAVERNAAEELRSHLKEVTGAEWTVVAPAEAAGRPVIAVGPGAAKAAVPGIDLSRAKLGDDGIMMRTIPPHLVLTGADGARRGTLYAVYSFLEEVVGVRWWTAAESTIPRRPDLIVPALDVAYVPRFRFREVFYTRLQPRKGDPDASRLKFAVRMRNNGHHMEVPPEWGGNYRILGFVHTFNNLVPPKRWFAEHPEWYSEIRGKRTAERSQLCLTNPDLVAELTRSALEWVRKDPEAGMICVSQNDWAGNCQCAECRRVDEEEGSPSGTLIRAVNQVAEGIEKEVPEFLVTTLAYHYTRTPPKKTRPRRNVVIRLAVIERSSAQPIDSESNRPMMEDLRGWSAVAPNLSIWDYVANLTGPFTPHPTLHVYGPDFRTYAANNVIGLFCQGNCYCALGDFDELKLYLMSHLLWDPSRDAKTLAADFLNGFYGKAGPVLQEYLALLTERIGDARLHSWGAGHDAGWLDLDDMDRATRLFDDAERRVAGDEALLARVRRARLSLGHQWLRGYALYRRMAEAQGKPFTGPADVARATEEFIGRVEGYRVTTIGHPNAEGRPMWPPYAALLRERAKSVTQVVPIPDPVRQAAGKRLVFDIQEHEFYLGDVARGAVALVDDAKASNGRAARINPAVVSWSVHIRELTGKGIVGRWRVHAVLRCEPLKEQGIAVTGGIYDTQMRKGLLGFTMRLEGGGKTDAAQVDPNTQTDRVEALAVPLKDGEYHLVDLGVHELHGGRYLWFGTTGGVSPENVKAVFIDRVLFTKEP